MSEPLPKQPRPPQKDDDTGTMQQPAVSNPRRRESGGRKEGRTEAVGVVLCRLPALALADSMNTNLLTTYNKALPETRTDTAGVTGKKPLQENNTEAVVFS